MKKEKVEITSACRNHIRGVKDTIDLIGGKWKALIIGHLFYIGKMRFMDIKRQVEGIAPKVLSKELKDLEINNIVRRIVNDTTPVSVEYELTDFGKSLHSVIHTMGEWGIHYRKERFGIK